MVAQSNPHFQSLTNIIYKWETKLYEQTDEYKFAEFERRMIEEEEALDINFQEIKKEVRILAGIFHFNL